MSIDFARNNLDRETSPYLRQHADNPVHWQPWSEAALAEAKRSGKPVLLSVGYAACHWCHVMAHESFEDPQTAELMNRLFVNIKVDREERPDIDTIYMSALHLLGEQGGWPLTMFLTPEGRPFWGGTYFPPEQRYGRPGFRAILERVREIYDTDAATIAKNSGALTAGLVEQARLQPSADRPELSPAILDRIASRLVQEIDQQHGGIGTAPKFPQVPILELLWRGHLRTGNPDLRHAVMLTLVCMSQGGIYDHVGGGFARYSVDAAWLVPHFEKMLYDNAALVMLMSQVWRHEHHAVLEARIRETVEWVLREMIAENGAFAASLDADSEGEEGRFYVWSEAEIDAVLGIDAAVFKRHYDITPNGNFEGHNIPNRRLDPDLADADTEALLAGCRVKLLERRAGRVRPGFDDKVLADWNGLMITAMVEAGLSLGEPAWIAAARRAFEAVVTDMSTADRRLYHSFRAGEARHSGLLDDHAAMARAALALHEATGEAAFLARAQGWVEQLQAHFTEPESGACYYTADDAEGLLVRSISLADNATPNGNAVLLEVLSRLWRLTGDAEYRARFDRIAGAVADQVTRNFFPVAAALNAVAFDMAALDIVVAGDPDDTGTAALVTAAFRQAGPDRLLARVLPGESLPENHPAHGKGLVEGRPAAWVCRQMVCGLPVTDADMLARMLEIDHG
ncbi:MAG: thioredoxin domain-containing protein [Pseudomonadota bacterium]|nr:thioredoxin domain-containing protein [Pseudomonadota bacterium]